MLTQIKKVYSIRIALFISIFVLGSFFVSCKNESKNEQIVSGTTLSVSINGIEESFENADGSDGNTGLSISKSASTSIVSKASYEQEGDGATIYEYGDFYAKVSGVDDRQAVDDVSNSVTKLSSVGVKGTHTINPIAANTPLAQGIKYRIILYADNSASSPVISSTVGEARKTLSIPVEKGKSYYWVAYSYNDSNDPQEPTNGEILSDQRDLIYASGNTGVIPGVSGDGNDISVPIAITLKHQLRRVNVEVSTVNYPASITVLSGTIGSDSYFRGGKLNIKDGSFAANASNTVLPTRAINFQTISSGLRRGSFYSAPGFDLPQIAVTIGSLSIRTNAGTTKSLSNKTYYFFPGNVGAQKTARASYTAKIDFLPLVNISNYRIASVGNPAYALASTNSNSGLRVGIESASNFSPTGTVKTNGTIVISQGNSSAFVQNHIDLPTTTIFIVSYGASYTAADSQKIIDFVNRGGTVLYYTQTTGPDEANLVKYFAGPSATVSGAASNAGRIVSGTYANGPFSSSLVGKYVGDGDGGAVALTAGSYSSNMIDVIAEDSNGRPFVWKAKNKNFYYFPDGSFDSFDRGTITNFFLDGSRRPTDGWSVIMNNSSYNSYLMLNIVANALNAAAAK
ncbi:hypothetical protein [Sphingobacterium hungaricum]